MMTSNQFTFDLFEKELTTDASDLQDNLGLTITILSSQTGREMLFQLCSTEKDTKGNVLFWIYKPVDELPNVLQVRIFND